MGGDLGLGNFFKYLGVDLFPIVAEDRAEVNRNKSQEARFGPLWGRIVYSSSGLTTQQATAGIREL